MCISKQSISEATYTQMWKFMMQESIYLTALITQVSGINDHGTTLNLFPFKNRY